MFGKKYGFGESKAEHIPKGLPHPGKSMVKNLPPSKLLEKIKQREEETCTGFSVNTSIIEKGPNNAPPMEE